MMKFADASPLLARRTKNNSAFESKGLKTAIAEGFMQSINWDSPSP
jgi:ATP-dependent Clp protease ATP-binding subunit ClpA